MNKEIQLAIDELRAEIERVIGEKKLMSEELETLRASNTIKQANIELLEAENAKLIAERDMLKLCADQNEDEVKKMHAELDAMKKWYTAIEKWYTAVVGECIQAGLPVDESNPSALIEKLIDFWAKRALKAEREAMMKQEPIYQIYSHDQHKWGDICAESYERNKEAGHTVRKLYPLPAQQIPEGGAIEILRKVFDLYESGADCYDSEDHYSAAYLGRCIRLDDDLFKSCVDLLSASQPKGDV